MKIFRTQHIVLSGFLPTETSTGEDTMKKTLTAATLILTVLFFFGQLDARASDCGAKVGTWEVEYTDGKKTTWELQEVDPSVFVFSCEMQGSASGEAYTGNFSLVQIVFDSNFYYTEAVPMAQDSPTTMLIFADDGQSFTVADNGTYPLKSGILIESGGSDDEECPASAALGSDDPRLETLRAFRDTTLSRSELGNRLIRVYYANSSKITALIEKNPSVKMGARKVLEVFCSMLELFDRK